MRRVKIKVDSSNTVTIKVRHKTAAAAHAHYVLLVSRGLQDMAPETAEAAQPDTSNPDHDQATGRRTAQAVAAAGGPVLTDVTGLPHRWEGPGHNGQPIEAAPVAGADLVATTAKPDEETKPPAVAPFKFGMPNRRRSDDEEPPF